MSSLRFVPREVVWRFPSPEFMLDYFRTWTRGTDPGEGMSNGKDALRLQLQLAL